MEHFDKKALGKSFIDSFTAEQKRWILSLAKEQTVTIDGTDFVFEETAGKTRFSVSQIDELFFDLINQSHYGQFFLPGVDLEEYIKPALEEELL